jgi:hypothetical protein
MNFGVNILANYVDDREALYRWLTRLQPSACVVMDNHGVTQHIRSILPQTKVIYRAHNVNDPEYHTGKMSPEQFVETHSRFADNGVILQVMNEPSGYAAPKPLVDWCRRVMYLADQREITLALPNFGVGHPDDHAVNVGEWDGLLELFGEYPRHYLATHEYFVVDPKKEPWHVGRTEDLIDRATVMGVKLRLILTECGRDVKGGVNDGWRGAGLSEAQYITKLQDAASIWRTTPVEAACVYCYGRGHDNRWRSFDIQDANEVKEWMVHYNEEQRKEKPVADFGQPVPDLMKVVKAPPNGANVRAEPGIGSAIIGALKSGDFLNVWERSVRVGNYNWLKVDLASGVIGYVADEVVDLDKASLPPVMGDSKAAIVRDLHSLITRIEAL